MIVRGSVVAKVAIIRRELIGCMSVKARWKVLESTRAVPAYSRSRFSCPEKYHW